MDKKTVFLELPSEMIDRIDEQNTLGDRSVFISNLIDKQLDQDVSRMSSMDVSTELSSRMEQPSGELSVSGEVGLVTSRGLPIGKFNVNTIEGFEELAQKICELSDDPMVRMRARRCRK